MDEFNQRKLFQDIDRRVLLVVASGILLSLLFFTLALAKRPGVQSDQTRSPALNVGKNLGFSVLKGSPGSNSVAPITAPVSSGQNCTHTARYWLEIPEDWPTDNLVVGQFTFRKDTILTIFQADAQDEVTRVQQQFLAAALNILQGANTGKIEAVMTESSAWLNENPAKIDLTEQEKAHGAELADRLANFNRGLTGPGACPGNPPESISTALSTPIVLPDGPVLGYFTSPLSTDGQPDQETREPRPRQENQPESASPAEISQPVPTVAPTSPPATQAVPTSQDVSSEPVISSPAVSQEPSQPAYNPPSQGPVAPDKESKKPKEKKNPKRPPKEQPPAPAAPSQPADQPPPDPQIGNGDPPGSSNPGNPGNDPGNGNSNGNGQSYGGGNGNGNGNGHGNGNGNGNGKGHGKKP